MLLAALVFPISQAHRVQAVSFLAILLSASCSLQQIVLGRADQMPKRLLPVQVLIWGMFCIQTSNAHASQLLLFAEGDYVFAAICKCVSCIQAHRQCPVCVWVCPLSQIRRAANRFVPLFFFALSSMFAESVTLAV